jgi:outer membrane cobalamin receptor
MSGNPGMTLNLLTPQYNTVRPVTKIRYLQGPYEYSLLDGLYTQNVAQGTNLTLGFQRHVSVGQFANSRFDSWNVRGRVRYNLSDRWNFALSHSYNRAINGMNGGIDVHRSPSLFNQVTAIVRTTEARHRTSRNDLTLSAIGKLFTDSASTTQITAYFSEFEHERHDSASVSRVYTSSMVGVRGQQILTLQPFMLRVGGKTEYRRLFGGMTFGFNSERRSALFAHGEVTPVHGLSISGGVRQEWQDNAVLTSLGGVMLVRLNDILTLTADAYRGERSPTLLERFFRFNLPQSEQHQGFTLGGSLYLLPTLTFSMSAHSRTINNSLTFVHFIDMFPRLPPIDPTPPPTDLTLMVIPEIRTQGFTAKATAAIWQFEASANVMFTDIQHGSTIKTYLPRWTARGELAYRQHVGSVDGRIGLRAHVASRHRGMQYHRLLRVFHENTDEEIGQFAVVDVFGTFRIGDAFLVMGWENVFDVKYMTTRWYPMPDRRFMLGVNWVFID